jgi:hypothetical protein
MLPFKFELGQTVKDKITGLTGIIMGRSEYLTQCNCYGLLQPEKRAKEESKPVDWVWFDEPRLADTGKKVLSLVKKEKTGGPHDLSEFPPQN